MKNRKKVILRRHDGWGDDHKLALTDDQIRLLNWLVAEDLVSNDDWDIQVLEDEDKWVEV